MTEPKILKCFLDGDALCIVRGDFVDLQESEYVFITLNTNEWVAVNDLGEKEWSKAEEE